MTEIELRSLQSPSSFNPFLPFGKVILRADLISFDKDDEKILLAIADGKFTLKGITNKELRKILPEKKPWQLSRILLRLKLHGLIKKVGKSYKYYLSAFGKQVIIAGLSFKNITLIPALSNV